MPTGIIIMIIIIIKIIIIIIIRFYYNIISQKSTWIKPPELKHVSFKKPADIKKGESDKT